MVKHGKGWNPDRWLAHRAKRIEQGRHRVVVPVLTDIPASADLGKYALGSYEQGQSGTCWEHCGKNMTEVTLNAQGYQIYSACRMLIGYVGEQILGGGNPGDGGTVTAALESMEASQGAGIAHESLDPYSDQSAAEGKKPPQTVYDDAKGHYLSTHAELTLGASGDRFAPIRQSIANKQAVGVGVWCPNNLSDPAAIKTNIDGGGEYGHALSIVGYIIASASGYAENLYKVSNWWDAIYEPIDASISSKWVDFADLIDGGKSHYFYWTETALGQVIDQGNAEVVVCSGAVGIPQVTPPAPPTPTPGPTPGPNPPDPDGWDSI